MTYHQQQNKAMNETSYENNRKRDIFHAHTTKHALTCAKQQNRTNETERKAEMKHEERE
jgi:hypothetical protein